MIIFVGYLLAVLMGLTLGLIGAGGSILTVPILVYFFAIPPLTATAYSLLVVGSTALMGAIFYHAKKLVDIKSAIIFAIPATSAVFLTRLFIIPNLPHEIFAIPKEIFIMLFFATLMLLAAFFMLRPIKIDKENNKKSEIYHTIILIIGSASIGVLTGTVGAGGGFLIIPTLLLLFNLSMKKAIGTSLSIIAINSLIGFRGDIISGIEIDWAILGPFILLTVSGMLSGILFSKNVDGQKLKKFFAYFVVAVAIAIFIQEVNQLLFYAN